MARSTLVPQLLTSAGLVPALVNADNANGILFPAKPGRFLWVKNTNAGVCNVTIREGPQSTVDGNVLADKVIVVPASTGERLIGPFPQNYTQADGNVYIDFSVGGATTQVGIVDNNG